MTGEELERAIESLRNHHAKVSATIERNSERISQLTQAVAGLTDDVQALTSRVKPRTVNVNAMREEMREGFNRLALANGRTAELIDQIARLNANLSQRVTRLEGRVDDLELKG